MERIDFTRFKKEPAPTEKKGEATTDQETFAEALKEIITAVVPGTSMVWHSAGDWSMHQLLEALLQKTGPAHVLISSYAFSETPTRRLAILKDNGLIKSLRLIIDNRVETRTAGSLQLLKGIADEMTMVATHAKVTLIRNSTWQISVIGSANYTTNVRHEAGIISCDMNTYGFNKQWIEKALYASHTNTTRKDNDTGGELF